MHWPVCEGTDFKFNSPRENLSLWVGADGMLRKGLCRALTEGLVTSNTDKSILNIYNEKNFLEIGSLRC